MKELHKIIDTIKQFVDDIEFIKNKCENIDKNSNAIANLYTDVINLTKKVDRCQNNDEFFENTLIEKFDFINKRIEGIETISREEKEAVNYLLSIGYTPSFFEERFDDYNNEKLKIKGENL